MLALSRLGNQIVEATAVLNAISARCALIGGLALASHQVVRATRDVDLLVDADRAGEIEAELLKIGYRCLHRSAETGNYARGDERLDLIYASRPIARRLLDEAAELKTALGDLRVVSTEGLASRCLMTSVAKQGEPPLAADGGLAHPVRREVDPYRALDDLMVAVEALCPVWPPREGFVNGGKMLL